MLLASVNEISRADCICVLVPSRFDTYIMVREIIPRLMPERRI